MKSPARHLLPVSLCAMGLAAVLTSGCGDDTQAGADKDATVTAGNDINGSLDDTSSVVADTVATPDTAGDTGADNMEVAAEVEQDVPPPDDVEVNVCPGGPGCACAKADDCDYGVCLDTAVGKRCSKTCTDSCPDGFTCMKYGSSDILFVCVPDFVSICSPCGKHGDCKVQGVEALCLDYGEKGSFCSGPCGEDGDCPAGFSCGEVFDKDAGKVFKQCKLVDPKADCTCSPWSTTAGFETACAVTNDIGTCKGTRKCTTEGLSACTALVPAVEICNGADDDCDGTIDNLPAEVTCAINAFADAGSKTNCASDADCGAPGEACDGGQCKELIGVCAGTPKCGADGKIICEGAKTPKVESCNEIDDDCDGQTDEDFVWVHPVSGDKVPLGQACGEGPCAGGKVLCKSVDVAFCDTDVKIGPDKCDGIDNDCDGKVDGGACDDGDACTIDACDPKAGACSNKAKDCDDGNQCTTDACAKATGECASTAQNGPCDDGDACTVGDTCASGADGKVGCVAGTKAQQCDDANLCTDDACQPDKGCVQLPNQATKSCFDGDTKAIGVGTCLAGVQHCKEGALQAECVGQVSAAKKEACDGKDDTCDGKTDEGCKIVAADASFAASFGGLTGGKYQLTVEMGGSSPAGVAASDAKGKTVRLGFVEWLTAMWK